MPSENHQQRYKYLRDKKNAEFDLLLTLYEAQHAVRLLALSEYELIDLDKLLEDKKLDEKLKEFNPDESMFVKHNANVLMQILMTAKNHFKVHCQKEYFSRLSDKCILYIKQKSRTDLESDKIDTDEFLRILFIIDAPLLVADILNTHPDFIHKESLLDAFKVPSPQVILKLLDFNIDVNQKITFFQNDAKVTTNSLGTVLINIMERGRFSESKEIIEKLLNSGVELTPLEFYIESNNPPRVTISLQNYCEMVLNDPFEFTSENDRIIFTEALEMIISAAKNQQNLRP